MKTFSERLLILVTVLYLVLTAGFLMLWHTGRLDEEPTTEIRPDNRYSQTLTVVGDTDYKPFSFINAEGKADGHDIELAAELANRMNMNLEVRLMNWEDAVRTMEKGEADLIMGIELLVDDKAHDFIEATVPISKDSITVFAPRPYRDIMALNSLKMAEITDSGREGILEASGIVVEHDPFPDYTSALKAVSRGDDDFVMMRYTTGMQTLKKSGITNLHPSVKLMDNYLCFGGNPRNPALLEAVNVELERMSSDGVMDRLSEKWMESFVSAQPVYTVFRHYPWLYGAVLAMLVIYALVLNMVSAEKNRQKILARSLRRDSVYQRALFSGAYAFVEFNLTQNSVTGDYNEINDGVPFPAGYKLGIRPPYTFSELFEWWYDRYYIGSEDYLERENLRERLLGRFADGDRMFTRICQAKIPSLEPRTQLFTVYLSRDNASGDVIGLAVVKDVTEEDNRRKAMEMNRKISRTLARNYMQIFYVSIPNNTAVTPDGTITAFPDAYSEYVRSVADGASLDRLMAASSTDRIEGLMGDRDSFFILFKDKSDKYCTLRGVRTGKDENTVVLGFAEKDSEIREIVDKE